MFVAQDRSLLTRSAVLLALLLLLVLLLLTSSDEPGSTAAMRLARVAALLPVLAGAAGALTLRLAEQRGELRALAALGQSPWRQARGVRVLGYFSGLLAVALLASPWVDEAALFPVLPEVPSWQAHADCYRAPALGLELCGRQLRVEAVSAPARQPGTSWGAALYLTGPLAVILPAWFGVSRHRPADVWAGTAALVLALVLVHAVAARLLEPVWLGSVGVPLLLATGRRWVRNEF